MSRLLDEYLGAARELLRADCASSAFAAWCDSHWDAVTDALPAHGSSSEWESALAKLPSVRDASLRADDTVALDTSAPLATAARAHLVEALVALNPWRKGPWQLFGVPIDAEWRCDWKWRRVSPHIASLKGRRILDVGCGNGYYAWRMVGAGASLVVGLDPSVLCLMQFRAFKHYLRQAPVALLPLGSEALNVELGLFDTVFSMGVLYHRREPLEHLAELRRALRVGGELVLETLIIEAGDAEILVPAGRYARMRNVWSLTSPAGIMRWLSAAGFTNVRCVNVTPTTPAEQRSTAWMPFNSLADFLDPNDASRTVEGHPAPIRAVFVGERG